MACPDLRFECVRWAAVEVGFVIEIAAETGIGREIEIETRTVEPGSSEGSQRGRVGIALR